MAYQPNDYYQATSLPMAVPPKEQQQLRCYPPPRQHQCQPQPHHHLHRYSVSPPALPDSVTTGSGSGRSAYSATSGSYAGSASGDGYSYDSASSANGLDLQDYMQDRFANAFDPLPLDRTLAVQTQTSGLLNAKHRELLDLQQLAQQRLARSRARLAEGYQDAKEVKRDLEWTQKRVSTLKTKASRKHSKEYRQARARYPSPEY